MLTLKSIQVLNYRSIRKAAFELEDLTPMVGYNNAGKSNILSSQAVSAN